MWMLAAAAVLAGCDPVAAPVATGAASPGSSTPGAPPAARLEAGDDHRRLERLESALDERDRRIRDLEGALSQRDARLEEMGKSIADLVERHDSLARKQGGEMQTLEAELARATAREAELRRRLDELARVLETLQASSLVPNPGREVPKIEARVISVERGSQDGAAPLVLLDVGRKHGVEPGFDFTIMRGGKPIAKVTVEQVRADICGARVVSVTPGESVREGDGATTRSG